MDSIEKICEQVVETDALNACNFFVQNVAKKLWFSSGYPSCLSGRANDMLRQLADSAICLKLGNGHDSATQHSKAGYFVVGGVIDTTGHVFVVVPGGPSLKGVDTPWINRQTQSPFLSRGGMPLAFNGSTNSRLRFKAKFGVDLMFSPSKFSDIRYYAFSDPRLSVSEKVVNGSLSLARTMSRTPNV